MDLPRETLVELLELQRIDTQIDRLEARKRKLPEQAALEEVQRQLSEGESRYAEQQARVDEIVTSHRKADGDVDLIGQRIAAEEAKLYGGEVTTPRELQSLQAEIESLKRRKGALEDRELEIMEQREGAEKIFEDLRADVESLRVNVQAAAQLRDAAAAEIERELAFSLEERDTWAPKFTAETLAFYDELRSKRGGIAIAAFVEGTCQGCNMKLPAQEAEKVRASDGLSYCDECRRVLVAV